jgi:flavin reductase (DIM6/NTAB) family NADH-FMN oxidoreductase RutF
MSLSKEALAPALGRIVSGVYIATVSNEDKPDGMMASWVGQAAFDPPALMMSVNNTRDFKKYLSVGQRFSINILSKSNMDIFKNFAKPHNEQKFDGIKLESGRVGQAPVFSDCVGYLDLVVKSSADAGDHTVYVGEIVGGAMLNEEAEPMVHIRKNGFQY